MRSCPNCGKEISQNASFCPNCQKYTSKKAYKKTDVPRLIAIGTFIYPFTVLIAFQFFTRRLPASLHDLITLLAVSIFLTLYTIVKKKTFFRFLSLFWNLFMMGLYAIWVNSFDSGGFIQ